VKSVLEIEAVGPIELQKNFSLDNRFERIYSVKALSLKPAKKYNSKEEAAIQRIQSKYRDSYTLQDVCYEGALELMERCCVPHPEDPSKLKFAHDPMQLQDTLLRLHRGQVQLMLENIQCRYEIILGTHGLLNDFWFEHADLLAKSPKMKGKFKLHHLQGNHHLHLENTSPIIAIASNLLKQSSTSKL
jgi:hypothetical protein